MVSSGNLFLTPNDHKKTLTIHKLSYHICQFIRLADPVTRIRAHDVRKYASSCSFVNTMLVGDLVSAMNWSSPATFFKFYFTQTEPLCTPVALPVGNQQVTDWFSIHIGSHDSIESILLFPMGTNFDFLTLIGGENVNITTRSSLLAQRLDQTPNNLLEKVIMLVITSTLH